MTTAKLFQHGGSQAVRFPRGFRFQGTEVVIEKRGDEVVLKPKRKPKLNTLNDVARYMAEKFPEERDGIARVTFNRPQSRNALTASSGLMC